MMFDLNDYGKVVDVLIVYEVFVVKGNLEDVGGLFYLMELFGVVLIVVNLEYYVYIIEDKVFLRCLIRIVI